MPRKPSLRGRSVTDFPCPLFSARIFTVRLYREGAMIPLITAVFLACMLQTPLQIQQREIHEQGTHYAVDVKYPEIEHADAFNAAVLLAVWSLTVSVEK